MAKRLALFCALFFSMAFAASAGDIAQFVNLGFSPDSKHFMFGQYGILEGSSRPYCEVFVVDVARNAFVPNGTRKTVYDRSVEPGTSPLGALLNAAADTLPLKKKYRIDHLVSGRLLYVLVDGTAASDSLEFRDFQAGATYSVSLSQNPPSGSEGAAFHLEIGITDRDGGIRNATAGNAAYRRPGVKAYHIKQIILAPDNASLVFIIQREEKDTRGDNVRYMVETLRLK